MNYKVRIAKKKYGPFSFEKMCELLNTGKINENSYTLKDGFSKWVKIKELNEFYQESPCDENEEVMDGSSNEVSESYETENFEDKNIIPKDNKIEEELPQEKNESELKNEIKNHGIIKMLPVKNAIAFDGDDEIYDPQSWFLVDGDRKEGPMNKDRAKKLLNEENLSDKAYAYRVDRKQMLFPEGVNGNFKELEALDNVKDSDKSIEYEGTFFKRIKNFFVFSLILGGMAFLFHLYLKNRPCPLGTDYVEVELKGKTPSEFIVKRLFLPLLNPAYERYCSRPTRKKGVHILHGNYYLFNDEGNKIVFQNYKHGLLHGYSNEYYADGQISVKANYENNKLNGSIVKYYQKNQEKVIQKEKCLVDSSDLSFCEGWYPDGAKKFTGYKSIYFSKKDGFANTNEGVWKFWNKDGTLEKIINYKNDKAVRSDYIDFKPIHKMYLKEKGSFLSFSPKGKYLFILTEKSILIYDYIIKKNIFEKDAKNIELVHFSYDEKLMLIKENELFKIVNIHDSKVTELKGLNYIKNIRFSKSNADHLIVYKNKVKGDVSKFFKGIYKISSNEFIVSSTFDKALKMEHISFDDKYFIKVNEGKIVVVDLINEKNEVAFEFQGEIKSIGFSPKGQTIFYISEDKLSFKKAYKVNLFNIKRRVIYDSVNLGSSENAFLTSISDDEKLLAFAYLSSVNIYDLDKKQIVSSFKYKGLINSLHFCQNSYRLAAVINSNELLIFNIVTGKLQENIAFNKKLEKIDFSSDGNLISVKTSGGKDSFEDFYLIDSASGRIKSKIEIEKKDYFSVLSNSDYISFSKRENTKINYSNDSHSYVKQIFSIKNNMFIMKYEKDSDISNTLFYFGDKIYLAEINEVRSKSGAKNILTIFEN